MHGNKSASDTQENSGGDQPGGRSRAHPPFPISALKEGARCEEDINSDFALLISPRTAPASGARMGGGEVTPSSAPSERAPRWSITRLTPPKRLRFR